jgi:N-acylneuraminate cytidylyltransferase/CMP-N,N'-diacetyllegionaminic acid synthase
MYNNKKVLAVIPARGGSKGLPGKNTRDLLGKPLIAWTIEQARNCSFIDEIVVSTDSPEIAEVSAKYGLPVPFMRPAELATDTAASADVLLHAINHFASQGQTFDYIIMLEPTSPLRKDDDIAKAIIALDSTDSAESIVGVCKTEGQHPAFLVVKGNGFLKPFGRDFQNGIIPVLRRQDIDDVYFFEGSLYISKVEAFKTKKGFYHSKTLLYEVEKWQSFEIDDECDFRIIETIMTYKNYE